ncbi:putative peptidoglycan muropeptide transporter SLC46 [Oratosquilla oratoria]|uniref:putative peptidoglycan muropeptide transporter SLC46 n=1 Tax=Oratosquilla oratoria TaxID=337810 RepID=UPI003F75B4FC
MASVCPTAPQGGETSKCGRLPQPENSTKERKETTPLLNSFNGSHDYTQIRQSLLREEVPLSRSFLLFLQNISVEPVLLLNAMGYTIKTIFATKMVLDKVCENSLEYPLSVCENLTAHTEEHVRVQRIATGIMMIKDLISSLPTIFFVLFLGAWSDRNGRKIPILLPVIGNFLTAFVYIINTYLWWLPPEYIILAAIPRALSGGLVTLLMATFSYISDTTNVRSRTMRIAFMDLMMFVGVPLGLYLSNVIYEALDYMGVFSISAAVHFVCVLYIILRIKNTRALSLENAQVSGHYWRQIFSFDNVKEAIRVTFQPREENKRFRILAFMIALCLLQFCFGAEPLVFLYTEAQYHWNYAQYTNLSIYTVFVGSLGTSILLPLLSYKLRVEDAVLGFVGSISKACGLCIQTVVTTSPLWLFIAATVSFLGGLPLIVTRAGISKLVSSDEVGKVFSVLGSWDAIIPLISGPSYTFLYDFTVSTKPGSMFILSIACSGTAAVIYLILMIMKWKTNVYSPKEII